MDSRQRENRFAQRSPSYKKLSMPSRMSRLLPSNLGTQMRVSRVVGKISSYLETLSRIDQRAELRDRVDNARTLVDGLESQLESTDNEDILHSVLSSH